MRLFFGSQIFGKAVHPVYANVEHIAALIFDCDVIFGAVGRGYALCSAHKPHAVNFVNAIIPFFGRCVKVAAAALHLFFGGLCVNVARADNHGFAFVIYKAFGKVIFGYFNARKIRFEIVYAVAQHPALVEFERKSLRPFGVSAAHQHAIARCAPVFNIGKKFGGL